LASYGRPEEPKSAGKEILLTVVLVAALAGAGWWTYNNYIGISGTHKAAVTAPTADGVNSPPAVDPAADNPVPMQAEKNNPKDAPAGAERSSADTTPAPAPKAAESAAAPESKDTKPATEPDAENSPKPATPVPTPARHEVSATRIPASQAAADPSDALFRRGESYLYGRNGTEDCGNALKYLKMAADQQHAKARSMMGTMYATGHCVPRDLPSSYRWFALALRVDPNNSILEKDLSAVWNQMTPPERQLATKSQ
jgi:TPR repeat protein